MIDVVPDLLEAGVDLEDFRSFSGELRTVISGRKRKGTSGLLGWGRYYLPHYYTDPSSKLHRTLSRDLSGFHLRRGRRYTAVAPRGNAKSTFATLTYPLRCICENLEKYIVLVSDTFDQAKDFLAAIKDELEDNARLAADYPYAVGRGKVWSRYRIQTANGVTVECISRGMKIRGRRKKQNRPTLIIVDDMENDDDAFSPTQREKTDSWFNKALMKAGSPTTNVIVVGTIIHRESQLSKLQKTPGWRHRFFKSVMRWPDRLDLWKNWEDIFSDLTNERAEQAARAYFREHKKEMMKGARVLWPERESLYKLMKMRVMEGRTAFESEKQNNPIDPSLSEWPQEYFNDHIWVDRWPPAEEFTIKVFTLDPSKGRDAKRGDYQAFCRLGRHLSGLLYVEVDQLRIPSSDLIEQGIDWVEKFKPDGFGVESNQWQELLAADFEEEAETRGLILPLYLLNNQVKKEVRIRRLTPYLSRRKFRFLRRSEGTRRTIEQMMDFPNGDHDDGPDALEMAIRIGVQISHEMAAAA